MQYDNTLKFTVAKNDFSFPTYQILKCASRWKAEIKCGKKREKATKFLNLTQHNHALLPDCFFPSFALASLFPQISLISNDFSS